jgi:DNA helicase HerA-like ATPase
MTPNNGTRRRSQRAPDRDLVETVAFSADGREFGYEAPVSADIEVGGWVRLETETGARYLGQVTTEEIAVREVRLRREDAAARAAAADHDGSGLPMRIRHSAGSGIILAREVGRKLEPPTSSDTFADAAITAADGGTVARFLAANASGARLPIGSVQRCTDAPEAFLRAGGFNRHTFLCGQSGSGKTYALGMLLEQLILRTTLRIVVIDPNSDYVRLGKVRSGVPRAVAGAYRRSVRDIAVLRPTPLGTKSGTLRAWFSDLAEPEQAAVLRMDPIADREEYASLSAINDGMGSRRYSLADVLDEARRSEQEAARQLALRITNLGVSGWSVWAHGRESSSADVIRGNTRGLVLDTGTLASASEKAVVAGAVLGGLWRTRERRQPTLIVIDEAHNVCPADPPTALHANATEYCINIAAEGRKFGLYLLLSTQRPQKIHPNVLSQCDSLVLMRMNSRVDLAELAAAFSFLPPTLLEEAMRFRLGEALIGGSIVPAPLIARVGGRVSEEGGADLPTTWAGATRRR